VDSGHGQVYAQVPEKLHGNSFKTDYICLN